VSSLPRKKQPPIVARLRPILPRLQLIEATVGAFMALVALAMVFYPGGTWWDKTTRGHRFWENFLCDLLHRVSLSGAPNLTSSRFAQLAMFVLVVGIVCAFSLAPEIVPSRKRLGRSLAYAGSFGALFLVAAPLFPSDRYPALHSMATVFGTLPAIVAFSGLVGAILIEPRAPLVVRGTSVTLLVLLVLCAGLYTWDVYLDGPSLKVLPGLERIATLLLLTWLMLVSRYIRMRLVAAVRLLNERVEASPQGLRSSTSKSSIVTTKE
jgi:hypothetical protein